MNVSLKELYDLLITEIGVLAIPRTIPGNSGHRAYEQYEIRSLTKTSAESRRDNSGVNIGSHHKANALFKEDVYFEHAPAVKDLVDHGTVKPNGNAQGVVLAMLDLLSEGRLRDETAYLEKLIHTSITYRTALNENLRSADRKGTSIKEDRYDKIEQEIHEAYEASFLQARDFIAEKLTHKMRGMLSEHAGEFPIQTGDLSLAELCTVCIAVCVCTLEVGSITRSKDVIREKQAEIRGYVLELARSKTSPVLREYYSNLWAECSMLKIRDSSDERTQMEKYIYPHFTCNREQKSSPAAFEKGRSSRRMVIAESGLGKSSYLDMLTSVAVYRDLDLSMEINEKNRKKIEELEKQIQLEERIVPVLIRAGEYQHQEGRLFGGLLDCVVGGPSEKAFPGWRDAMAHQKDRRLILMVDALDEIDHLQRDSFLRGLNEFAEELACTDILAMCRPIDRSSFERNRLFRGMEEWRLEPFDRQQMKAFVEARIKADTRGIERDADRLLDNILHNEYRQVLSFNPYMLEKMLVHDYSTGNSTAYSTMDFLVANLIARRWDRLFAELKIEAGEFTTILGGVAHDMMCKNQAIIGRANLVDEFMKMAKAAELDDKFPEEMFREIVGRMNNAAGLLIYENEGYKFQYPVFASYLSAKWICYQCIKNRTKDANLLEDLLPPRIRSGAWADVVIMLFTIACEIGPRNEFLSTVLFRKILCMGMGTTESACRAQVNRIFHHLEQRIFGENHILSDGELRTCMEEFSRFTEGETQTWLTTEKNC